MNLLKLEKGTGRMAEAEVKEKNHSEGIKRQMETWNNKS
jgi:hypothetical protein